MVDQLAKKFRDAAIEKARLLRQGDTSRDSDLHAVMASSVRSLYETGDEGRAAIRALSDDESLEVAAWAAAELLSSGDLSAVPKLEAIARQEVILGFDAEMILREHRQGRLGSPFGTAV